jgi:hypothetical protein
VCHVLKDSTIDRGRPSPAGRRVGRERE